MHLTHNCLIELHFLCAYFIHVFCTFCVSFKRFVFMFFLSHSKNLFEKITRNLNSNRIKRFFSADDCHVVTPMSLLFTSRLTSGVLFFHVPLSNFPSINWWNSRLSCSIILLRELKKPSEPHHAFSRCWSFLFVLLFPTSFFYPIAELKL